MCLKFISLKEFKLTKRNNLKKSKDSMISTIKLRRGGGGGPVDEKTEKNSHKKNSSSNPISLQ